VELPQHNSMFNEFDFESLLLRASRCLDFNVEAARNIQRIGAEKKLKEKYKKLNSQFKV
jgi:hypothetical protein